MVTKLTYIESDQVNPYKNLAVEEYLLLHCEDKECILYLWQNQNTVVIGRNQNAWKECKVTKLEEENGKNAEDVFKELTTKDGKPIENILVDEKKAPDVKIPSFTTKFNSGEQKKGTQKLREMSLDDRMKLKAEDPDYYATLLNDR